jgi:hypothetical protein
MNTGHPLTQESISGPVICFVALPFGDRKEFRYESVLMPALRMVLERHPYYWRVGRADDELFKGFIYDNVGEWLKRAHVYIADISDLSYNVMMEFGYMLWAKKPGQPLVALERSASTATLPEYKDLADIQGLIRTPYPESSSMFNVGLAEIVKDELAKHFRNSFRDNHEMQKLSLVPRQHYLSPLWIEEKCRYTDEDMTGAISKKYITMETFRDTVKGSNERITTRNANAAADDLSAWRVTPDVIRNVLNAVISLLGEGHT